VLTFVFWGLLGYQKILHQTGEILSSLKLNFCELEKTYNVFNLLYKSQKSNLIFYLVSIIYAVHFSYIIISKILHS
jgi:hypothetical protein